MEQTDFISKSRKGKHLTKEERVVIEKMIRRKYSTKEIALAVDKSVRTIQRELIRGKTKNFNTHLQEKCVYSSDRGQDNYDKNATAKGPQEKLGTNLKMARFIGNRILMHKESPSVVAHRLSIENIPGAVTAKTIYRYIDQGLIKGVSNETLWEKRKRRKRTRRVVHRKGRSYAKRRSIDERPEHIDSREEFGHWEIDLVVGKQGSRGALLTIVERKTRKLIVRKLKNKTNAQVVRAINSMERELGAKTFAKIFKSITADNGSEFLRVEKLQNSRCSKKLRTNIFYAHAYASWERGSNENANKMIRRFIAKGEDIGKVSRKKVKLVEEWINNYPRRVIEFNTAEELYRKEITKLAA